MRAIVTSFALVALALTGCQHRTAADKIDDYFENKADTMDALAEQQPTAQAKRIYHNRANALRQEGEERESGLRKSNAGMEVPRMSNVEAGINQAESNITQ
jgi:hypothetical protein